MISGATSAESVLPGNPAVISRALETVGAGIGPARAVSNAWRTMNLSQWQGRAASNWASFVPREAARTERAAAAFNQVATAVAAYQSAFAAARTEINAAILDAAAAERSTAIALQEHREAARRAALAEVGTPEAAVQTFHDPGATRLANAHSRAQAALAVFNSTGDEIAARIRAAAGQTSDEDSGIDWGGQVLDFAWTFFWKGVGGQLIDTGVGVWQMLPVHYMFDDWFNDGEPWWEQYGDLWGGIVDSIVSDPGGAVEAMWLDFIAADHWDEYAGEGTGRVVTNVVMLFVGGLGIVRGLRNLRSLGGVSALQISRMTSLLKNSAGVSVQGSRVVVNGIDKMSLEDLAKLYQQSVHNMDADQATLGKYLEDDPASYEQIAQANGTAHFSLEGDGWSNAKNQYALTNAEMFELLNKPFLDEIIERKIPVEFTSDPTVQPSSALYKELNYLELHGYEYDPRTGFANYEGD